MTDGWDHWLLWVPGSERATAEKASPPHDRNSAYANKGHMQMTKVYTMRAFTKYCLLLIVPSPPSRMMSDVPQKK
jgi:hypothetical protein